VVIGIGDVHRPRPLDRADRQSATSGFAAALKLRGSDRLDVAQLIASLNQTLHTWPTASTRCRARWRW